MNSNFSERRTSRMGINQKTAKHRYERHRLTPEEKLERDLKKCMNCRFFWGNNSRCAKQHCCKPEEKKQIEMPKQCKGCPYYQGNGYCFPCMRKLIGR
jgi:hypothetical protein